VQSGRYDYAYRAPDRSLLEASPADRAVAEENATIMSLPVADLEITVELAGVRYRLVGVDPQINDPLVFPVRLIESGRWLQRFDEASRG
jgi:hypothetical protein